MKSHNHLAQQFLDCRPAEAAQVLEDLAAPESAALLGRVPARLAAPVFSEMLHPNATAIAALLPADKLEALLPLLSNTCVAALLRSLPAAARKRQLQQLPRLRAKLLQMLLHYPATSVGAWMDTHVFTLPENGMVDQALNRMRRTSQALGHKIYVLDRQQHLIGEIPLPLLLQQREDTLIADLLQPVSDSLRARATLASAADYPGWGRNTELPVVDHQRLFLGCLQQTTLQKVLRSQEAGTNSPLAPAREGLGSILWQAVLGAWQVGVQLVASDNSDH